MQINFSLSEREILMRCFLLHLILILALSSMVEAVNFDKNQKIAVMDFGIHEKAISQEIRSANVGKAACDYIIEAMVESTYFNVADRRGMQAKFDEEGLKTEGIIDPETAKKIADKLQCKYIIYGNISDLTASDISTEVLANGVKVYTITAHIIARMMDVDTGDIVNMVKGEGKSKSSFTQIGSYHTGYFKIGTKMVTQDSVHNAIKKAACSTVDILIERLYEIKPKKKK